MPNLRRRMLSWLRKVPSAAAADAQSASKGSPGLPVRDAPRAGRRSDGVPSPAGPMQQQGGAPRKIPAAETGAVAWIIVLPEAFPGDQRKRVLLHAPGQRIKPVA